MNKNNTVAYVLLTFSAFFWAASSVVGRYVAGEVPPMALNFCRWFLALAVVLTWTWKEIYENRALILKKWKYFSFLAISSAIGFGALHFIALQYTGAINGALLQGLMPICILLTALVVLGDPFGAREMIGIALGFLGITCIVTQGRLSVLLGMSFNIGDIMLLVGTVSWSIYAVYLRRAPSVLSASTLMALMFAFAALYTFPLWMIEIFVFDYVLPLNSKSSVGNCFYDDRTIGTRPNFLGLFGVSRWARKSGIFYLSSSGLWSFTRDTALRRNLLSLSRCRDSVDFYRNLARYAATKTKNRG